MAKSTQLQKVNAAVLTLVQAMIGAISPNFRAVSLTIDSRDVVNIHVVLENESAADREAIDDIATEFEAISGPAPIGTHVEVYAGKWAHGAASVPGRLVFMRKWSD